MNNLTDKQAPLEKAREFAGGQCKFELPEFEEMYENIVTALASFASECIEAENARLTSELSDKQKQIDDLEAEQNLILVESNETVEIWKQSYKKLESELSDYRALVDAADEINFPVNGDDCTQLIRRDGKWFEWRLPSAGKFDSVIDAFKSLQAENKS